jgi:ABC-type uncharacterized transport system substrate-binding protein
VDRRAFIVSITGSLLAAPLAAEAQQADRIARIGYLANHVASSPHLPEAFRQGLRDLGYVEGRNVVIEYRDAEGKLERLRALAAELVALKVDVIAAFVWLEIGTVAWNAIEGIIAVAAGVVASSVALVGFGVDSFVETTSGAVVGWQLQRCRARSRGQDSPSGSGENRE